MRPQTSGEMQGILFFILIVYFWKSQTNMETCILPAETYKYRMCKVKNGSISKQLLNTVKMQKDVVATS